MTDSDDLRFLSEAIELAREKLAVNAGGPFAAMIVREHRILGRGWNCVTSLNDPTAHAEIMAIRDACRHIDQYALPGATIFCSCEPCPLCLAAIYWARLDRVVYAATSQDAAAIGFDDRLIYEQLSRPPAERSLPSTQAMQAEAQAVMQAWRNKPDRIDY